MYLTPPSKKRQSIKMTRSTTKRKRKLGIGRGSKDRKLNKGKDSFKPEKISFGLKKNLLPPKKLSLRKAMIPLHPPTKTKVELKEESTLNLGWMEQKTQIVKELKKRKKPFSSLFTQMEMVLMPIWLRCLKGRLLTPALKSPLMILPSFSRQRMFFRKLSFFLWWCLTYLQELEKLGRESFFLDLQEQEKPC